MLYDITLSQQALCSFSSDFACGFVCSENESDEVQYATASSARGVWNASSAIFTWEDMTSYVGHREQFVENCGPQNEFQNETHCAKVFKMFF
jgi:hypothetical protein